METESDEALVGRRALGVATRVVIKLGTNVVTHNNGELALGRVSSMIEQVVALRRAGREVILVSSGAVGLGSGRLGLKPELLSQKQACAAVGQVLLTAVYEQAFARFGIPIAQILVTEDDFSHRTRYLNLRNTFLTLLHAGVVPVVNENDPVSTVELETGFGANTVFGDNDKLSALVTSKIDADLLIMLSNVDGLYTAPGPHAGGTLIHTVATIDKALSEGAGGSSGMGRGGMRTKLEAARICTECGALAVIANGQSPDVISKVLSGEIVGTLFLPSRKLSSRKRWIAFAGGYSGQVTVTQGAREALEARGASLLFAGVSSIEGAFERGDVLSIVGPDGEEFARGMSNHASDAARALIGRHTSEVAEIVTSSLEAFITRDNLVLTRR